MNKEGRKSIRTRLLAPLIVISFFSLVFFHFYSSLGYPRPSFLNKPNSIVEYSNNFYSLKYPSYLDAEDHKDGKIWLHDDQKWGDEAENYRFIRGLSISVEYKENTTINDYLTEQTRHWTNRPNTENTKVNGRNAIKITNGYSQTLKTPNFTRLIIENKSDIASVVFSFGDETTREEYNNYLNAFNLVMKNLKFKE